MNKLRDSLIQAQPLFLMLYLGVLGMMCIYAVQLYLGDSVQFEVGGIFLALVFGIYALNRFTDTKEDFANNTSKYLFFAKWKIVHKIGLVSILVALATLGILEKLKVYHLILVATGVLYSYRLLPWYHSGKGIEFYRLKEIPFVKNLSVSLLWGSAVFVIPILFTDATIHSFGNIYLLAVAATISTLCNTLFGDIRDDVGDQIAGNRTIPVLYGTRRALTILAIVHLTWMLSAGGLYVLHIIDVWHFGFVCTVALYPLVYMYAHYSRSVPNGLADFLMESDLLVFSSGMVVLSFV